MALDAATNPWTKSENALATALPECASFRSLVGAADATAAAKSVFLEELGRSADGYRWSREELETIREYAIVSSGPERPYHLQRSSADGYIASGTLTLLLSRLVTEAAEAEAAEKASGLTDKLDAVGEQLDREMKNYVGSMLTELVDYWDENGGPWFREGWIADGPLHTHPEERATVGHWQTIDVAIAWGFVNRR